MESNEYALLGLVYAGCVSFLSLASFWQIENSPGRRMTKNYYHTNPSLTLGYEILADIVGVLWIGLGVSILAWAKVYMASPSFGTGEPNSVKGKLCFMRRSSMQHGYHCTLV